LKVDGEPPFPVREDSFDRGKSKMPEFIENCADDNNATLGHNWFLNIANYLHEIK
jgi:hypothetical protein